MASLKANMEKMEIRQHYSNRWHTDLLNAPEEDPAFCCFALCCGPCASYLLRKRALYNDMSRYTCCGGFMPCSGHCGESTCPEFCLCTEVLLCFANSVASTRFMIQDEFNIQTTKCDNCIIGFMFCLQQLACIFSLIACILGSEELEDAAQLLNCFADLVYCSVCPCMQTQHKAELDKRDGKFVRAPAAMAVPPVQQMSRLDHPLPPPVGYLPSPAYGYPPTQQPQGSYPPPHFHGYPAPPQFHGYPPQTQGYPPPPQSYGYLPPPQSYGYPPSPEAQGIPPASHSHSYPPPPQAQGIPPASHSHIYPPPPQVQASPLDSDSQVYPPPPPQTQASSPASHSHGHTQPPPQAQGSAPPSEVPPPQAQGSSPHLNSHEHPHPPPGHSHSPAGSAHPPPGHPV